MELLTDNDIFDLLDGVASEEVTQRHEKLCKTDESYRQYFSELHGLNESLNILPLESPSLAFENTLINRWEAAQTNYKIPTVLKRTPFIFAGIMLSLMFIVMLFFIQLQPTTTGFTAIDFEKIVTYIAPQSIQKVLLPVNGILLILILEKIIKKHWKLYFGQV